MIHPTQQTKAFGRRKDLPRVSITRGGTTKTYTVRPWLFGTVIGTFLMFGAGYLGATGYLLYRDDLLGASVARQQALEDEYEERIARLRSEMDRVTSRHAVEAQGVEAQIGFLLDRQEVLEHRQAVLDQIIGKARKAGLAVAAGTAPRPIPKPGAAAAPREAGGAPLAYAPSERSEADVITGSVFRSPADTGPELPAAERLRPVLKDVHSSLDLAEQVQVATIDALSLASESEIDRLSGVLTRVGLPGAPSASVGGPFVPAEMHFVDRLQGLGRTLDEIAKLRKKVAAVPLATPIKGAEVTSGFGYRVDPFLRRPALHSGIDFRAEHGTQVHATAPGKVVFAGWKGGYGRCIEIAHPNGIMTRYGHLSAISVREGDEVAAGAAIGRVGSTGRSTGPHLHYETRRRGEAVDPRIYLAAGRAI